ncbi:MAG: hypothetical protein ACFFAU_08635 [Candidatus Hodarchaeota archaeon]
MERKIRNRVNKNDAKLLLIKLLPLIFYLFVLLASSSLASASEGPNRPAWD